MRKIYQSAVIESEFQDTVKQIELRGRLCYKSEDKITEDSAQKFVDGIIKRGHNSVLEMAIICVNYEISNPTKYLNVGNGITSGSIRAWRDYFSGIKLFLFCPLYDEFCYHWPSFFNDNLKTNITNNPFIDMPTNDPLHTYVCARIITNRAVTHEIVRHRPVSYLQESQRYVRYDVPEGIEFITPVWHGKGNAYAEELWRKQMSEAEVTYCKMLESGLSPQQARGCLPNDTKTEILVYANLREWSHIFYMRSQGGADPQMIDCMLPLLEEFREEFPGVFDDLKPNIAGK